MRTMECWGNPGALRWPDTARTIPSVDMRTRRPPDGPPLPPLPTIGPTTRGRRTTWTSCISAGSMREMEEGTHQATGPAGRLRDGAMLQRRAGRSCPLSCADSCCYKTAEEGTATLALSREAIGLLWARSDLTMTLFDPPLHDRLLSSSQAKLRPSKPEHQQQAPKAARMSDGSTSNPGLVTGHAKLAAGKVQVRFAMLIATVATDSFEGSLCTGSSRVHSGRAKQCPSRYRRGLSCSDPISPLT